MGLNTFHNHQKGILSANAPTPRNGDSELRLRNIEIIFSKILKIAVKYFSLFFMLYGFYTN